jgi:hypothetical protein
LPAVAVRVLRVTADDHVVGGRRGPADRVGPGPDRPHPATDPPGRPGGAGRRPTVDRAVVLLGFDAFRNSVLAVSVFQALGSPGGYGTPAAVGRRFSRRGSGPTAGRRLLRRTAGRVARRAAAPGVARPTRPVRAAARPGKLALDVALPRATPASSRAAPSCSGGTSPTSERTGSASTTSVRRQRCRRGSCRRPSARRRGCTGTARGVPATSPRGQPRHAGRPARPSTTHRVQRELRVPGGSGRTDIIGRADRRQVDQAVAKLVARMEPRSAALGLGQTTRDDLYRQAWPRRTGSGPGRRAVWRPSPAGRPPGQSSSTSSASSTPPCGPTRRSRRPCRPSRRRPGAFVGVDRLAAFSLPRATTTPRRFLCDADGAVVEAAVVELPGMGDLTAGGDGVTERNSGRPGLRGRRGVSVRRDGDLPASDGGRRRCGFAPPLGRSTAADRQP